MPGNRYGPDELVVGDCSSDEGGSGVNDRAGQPSRKLDHRRRGVGSRPLEQRRAGLVQVEFGARGLRGGHGAVELVDGFCELVESVQCHAQFAVREVVPEVHAVAAGATLVDVPLADGLPEVVGRVFRVA